MERRIHITVLAVFTALVALAALGATRARSAADTKLPRLETQLFGQSSWLVGSPASVRIIARDHTNGQPVRGARVQVALLPPEGPGGKAPAPRRLFQGRTNALGTVDAGFKLAGVPAGSYRLKVDVAALGEKDELAQSVTLREADQVLLVTDKPLYQPGQTIHIRALALRQPDQRPVAGRPAVLEVQDSKGNKVFKKKTDTSAQGIVASDFVLASEVNQGPYTVRAQVGQAQQEKTVTVQRYVLPKFKVALTPDKSFYQPGQVFSGKVQADYFFGKPVAGAKVVVTLSKFDAGFQEFARIQGNLDTAGALKVMKELPNFFAGTPLEQGSASVKYDVEVTDTAEHTEKVSGSVPVSAQPLKLTVVPESGRVVPNLENVVYILATYPDGSPAAGANVTVEMASARLADKLTTDAGGVAEWRVVPREPRLQLHLIAVDKAGARAESNVDVTGQYQPGSLILRADRALYTVGDTMHLTVLAPDASGTAYIDLVRAGQTVLTKSAPIKGGKATLPVSLSPDAAGTLQVHAYRVQPDGQIVRDTRVVFVDPGSALKIGVKADKETYLPGATAKLTFQLQADGRTAGRAFPAALGVSIVDESVFALQEMQPGMEKVYFLLEKEILEPRYEIHGITPETIVQPAVYRDQQRQQAAAILFASLPRKEEFTLRANSYDEKLAKMMETWQKQVNEDADRIAAAIKAYRAKAGKDPDWEHVLTVLVDEGLLKPAEIKDPFGHPYRVQGNGQIILSDGADGKQNSGDEIGAYVPPNGKAVAWGGGMWRFRKGRFGGPVMFERLQAMPMGGMGGFGGGMGMGGALPPVPMAAAAPADGAALAMATSAAAAPAAPQVRVREYFPETLFWQPALITDEHGRASVEVPIADSITTWRMTAMASSPAGLLGSVSTPMRVFQDFFVDIDFPVSLTQNDEVSVPVAVYNYLDTPQKVRLVVDKESWFELMESPEKTLDISSSDVRGTSFRLKVKEIGFHKLTVRAFGTKMNDAVRREVEVVPDGRRVEDSINDRLEGPVHKTINIPEGAIPGASNILVKVYPGMLSQAVEGMDKILQMPFGCFEQTSSTTYPNILVMDYMKSSNKITPEIQMKAEQYINLGYQRLLTFEVPGGGFSWFGDAPANKVLTAYGLMEFNDMSDVHDVDPSLIARTRDWLLKQQQPDGSFKPDASYLHEESWGRIQHNEVLPTAFITWALLAGSTDSSGKPVPPTDARVKKAVDFVATHWSNAKDPYTLGIIANTLVAAGRREANDVLGNLLESGTEKDGGLSWESKQATVTYSHGGAANVEATALIGYALVRSGRYPAQANKVVTYLIRAKDPSGTWGSTQATVLALKTLLESAKGASRGVDARVNVRINGEDAGSFQITPENADVMQMVDLKKFVKPGANAIEIGFEGKGNSLYQVSSYHYMPWTAETKPTGGKPDIMGIQVKYDRTELEKDAVLTGDVTVAYNGPGAANMVMVDLGIPPGFDVVTEDLAELVGSKVIQRYQLTPRQVILYFDKVESGKPVTFRYRMKAKFPIRAKTAPSVVYQYYNPEIRSTAPPVEVVVR